MSGYVDLFFQSVIMYLNLLWQAEIIKYLLSFFVVLMILGLLRKLLHVNDYNFGRKGV